MNQTIITSPDASALEVEQTSIVKRANDLAVVSEPEHAVALLMLKDIATAQKRVQELFKEPKDAAFKAHRAITEAEGKLLNPLAEARGIVSRKATAFEIEMQRRADEETRRQQEEARKAEEERALQDAVLAEAEGDKAGAEAILAAPVDVPTIKVEPQVAKMAGISSRTNYKAEVTDLLALVKYVAANPHELALLQINATTLNGRAKSMRDGFQLPGCKLIKEILKAVKVG